MTVAAVLLAAGQSTRFGMADKLAAPLKGMPLRLHAVRALAPLPLAARFVVTGRATLDWPGLEVVVNDRPETGMAHSIALGLAAARRSGAQAVLIVLADMPFVPTEHYRRLLACYRGPDSLAASSDGTRRMPPALFGADWFAILETLSGDQGARALLDRAESVVTAPENLHDIDWPEDFAAAQAGAVR
ncbi:MAG TPA: nucleotidyltransferase family protein [Sphingomonas sp.]